MAKVESILIATRRRTLLVRKSLHKAELACRRVAPALLTLLTAAALANCQPDGSEGIKCGWFYRFNVELSHGDEPINIEIIIACGSEARQIPGEGRSARAVWVPYIYGVRTKSGEGVLVQSPNVCDRDVVKEPLPADFLPVVFWAPDAGNLEFLIAYLHERAYEQPISKLTFHRATVTEATEADYKAWRETRWKDNIVPTGDRREYDGRGYFRGEGFFPKGDPRNKMLLRMACHSFIRAPISGTLQDAVRARWPTDHPRYWLLDSSYLRPVLNKDWLEINDYARRHGKWDREALGALASFYEGKGVNRSSGVGHIERNPTPAIIASGLAPRIPYRTDTGYPWASDRLLTQGVLDTHIDTAGGADQGFAYCYRDMFSYYFPRPQGGEIAAADHRIFVDGQLVGSWPQARSLPPAPAIVERDEYLWFTSYFDLTHELARME